MRKTCLICLGFIFISIFSNSQDYIGANWARAKKILVKSLKKDSIDFDAVQTDSSYQVVLNDSNLAKEELYLHFSKLGICNQVKLYTRCSDCLQHHFDTLYNNLHYKWKKISNNKYVSRPAGKLVLEIIDEDSGNCPYIYLYRYQGSKRAFKNLSKQ